MSLINQVLKDLDARQPLQHKARLNLDPVNDNSQPFDWLRMGVWGMTIALVVAYFVYVWWFEQQPQLSESVDSVMPAVVMPNKAATQTSISNKTEVEPKPPELIKPLAKSDEVTVVVNNNKKPKEPDYLPLKINEEPAQPRKATKLTESQKSGPSEITVKPAVKTSLQNSRDLINSGRLTEAESSLYEWLKNNPADAVARDMLIGLMLRSNRNEKADELLETGLRFYPSRESFVLIKANRLIEQGDKASAIALLQKQLKSQYAGEKAMSMLASLQQQSGNYPDSTKLYQKLIAGAPENGRYWLGLAISLDAQNMTTNSREAFVRALQTGGLDKTLQDYAKQRIQSIDAKTSVGN